MDMKKTLLLIAILGLAFSPYDSSFYQLQCKDLDQHTINLTAFRGKKVIVTEFDAGKPDRNQLLSLDSLYRQHASSLAVIAVPVEDFSAAMPVKTLKGLLIDTLKLSYPIAAIGKAQKKNANNQYQLLQWLTNKSLNRHFDRDIDEAGQLFVVSESGVLYATLKHQAWPTGSLVKEVLGRQVQLNE